MKRNYANPSNRILFHKRVTAIEPIETKTHVLYVKNERARERIRRGAERRNASYNEIQCIPCTLEKSRQCVGRVEQTGRGVRRFHDTFRAGCARFNDMPPGIISNPLPLHV